MRSARTLRVRQHHLTVMMIAKSFPLAKKKIEKAQKGGRERKRERELTFIAKNSTFFLFDGIKHYNLAVAARSRDRSRFGTGGLIIADIINLDESGVAPKMKAG